MDDGLTDLAVKSGSASRPVPGEITITIANFAVVQIGTSSETSTKTKNNRETVARERQQEGLKQVKKGKGHGPLKENSVPDDAFRGRSVSSTITQASESDEKKDEDRRMKAVDERTRNNVEYCLPLIKKQGSLTGKRCEAVMETLETLQDGGHFETHALRIRAYLKYYTESKDNDMVASVKIEQGIARFFENDLKGSRRLYREVIRMGEALHNRNLLQGRAYFQLAATYRRQKKFGKAIGYLQRAEALLSFQEPGEDTAELLYSYAVEWLYLYWNSFAEDEGRAVFKARAKEYLERAADHNERDDRARVRSKRELHFHLSVATLLLDCGTTAARENRTISREEIAEAKIHLDIVECRAATKDIPLGRKIKLLKTRSDQYRREGKFAEAKETAEEALALAKESDMNMHVQPLQERIEEATHAIWRLTVPGVEANTAERLKESGWSAGLSASE